MRCGLQKERGQLLVQTLILAFVATTLITGIINWARVNLKASREAIVRENAIELAESGIDYYRWHLAHAQNDFQDGTGAPGPYIHTIYDKDGNVVGEYSLTLIPPPLGSTKVVIRSTGTPVMQGATSTISRTIKVEMAIPSIAKYAVVANDAMRFGEGTEVFGPIHSNNGIRFDGLAHNLVTSAVLSYDDADHTGNAEFGVHTHLNAPPSSGSNDTFRPNEAPPTNPVPTRTDVFESGREFPVPAVDFVGLTSDLAQIKADAQTSGRYVAPSGSQGYQIILKTNDTFDLYRVNTQIATPNGCTNAANQTSWGTWSINTRTFIANYAIPANGLVFIEDNVWVEGSIDGARITIASGRFPDNPAIRPNIIINNNLSYTNIDGSDAIGLLSQGNAAVGLNSQNNLEIDAALIAQNGRVGRFYYSSSCGSNYTRNSIALYGMIATNLRYGFAYTDGTGYQTRNINYDANLLYGPPPSFPLTSDQYEILSWEEI